MSENFIESQQKKLVMILKSMNKTALFNHLNLHATSYESNWITLYEEFVESVPLGNITSFLNMLRAITGDIRASDIHVLSYPKVIHNNLAVQAALHHHTAFPVNKNMLSASFLIEEKLQKGEILGINPIKRKMLHIFDDIHSQDVYDITAASFHILRYQYASKSMKKKILPNLYEFQGIGASRYQKIHAFIMLLEKHGAEIDVIFVRPQILSEIALILAQREGRFIGLNELCPSLKLVVHYGENIAPYKQAIFEFLKGTSCQRMQMIAHPSGLLAYQESLYDKNILTLSDHEGVFYEFIPINDLKEDGSLKKHFRRKSAEQTKEGHSYVLALSNQAGLLGFNTEEIVEIYSKEPFRVIYKGKSEMLDYFGEKLQPFMLEYLIEVLNQNFKNYNFYIREYLISDHVEEHKSYWLFELSHDVQRIDDSYLQSAANSIHNEMSLNNNAYRQALLDSTMPIPEIYFLPVGSISSQQTETHIEHIDFDESAELVKSILKSAMNYKKFTPINI